MAGIQELQGGTATAADAVGAAARTAERLRKAVDGALAHGRKLTDGGKGIDDHQAHAERLACMATEALAAELMQYAREHLAHYMAPRSLDFIEEMPRLPTGKLYKRVLRDAYWQGDRKI